MTNRTVVVQGTLETPDTFFSVTVVAKYTEHGTEPVRCKIIPDMSFITHKSQGADFDELSNIHGTTDQGKQIFIPELRLTSYTSYAGHGHTHQNPKQICWEAEAHVFVEGQLGNFDSSDGSTVCTLYVSPLPLTHTRAHYIRHDDGQIKIENSDQKKAIEWITPFGKAELTDTFHYLRDKKVGFDSAITQIRRNCIKLYIDHTKQTALEELLISLQNYFDDLLWLVSFLSRKRVAWYEGTAEFFPSTRDTEFRKAFIRRRAWLGYTDDKIDNYPLIDPEVLRDGLFGRLVGSYSSSSFRQVIHQTIVHLLLSYERVYIENQYTSVYTALEGLVFGLDEDKSMGRLVGKSPFRRLRKKIEDVLREEIKDKFLYEQVSKKLPELQRRSFVDQLLLQLQRYNIDLATVWPESKNTVDDLRAIVSRRNVYLHQGRMEELPEYSKDIYRIQYLLEAWILSLLQCSID